MIQSLTIKEWDEIHAYANRRGWFFRGQSQAKWNMKTSIERAFEREGIAIDRRVDLERELLREFKRAYHQFGVHVPKADAEIEWLALMQHYGAPTRLLDFTYSIYIAAYFALEHADEDSSVFGINGPWASQKSIRALDAAGKARLEKHKGRTTPEQEKEVFDAHFDPPFVRSAYPVNPFRLNDRLRIQKGLFAIPGDGTIEFMKNLESLPGHDSKDNAIKLVIPLHMRKRALEHLYYMNVSRTSLFPGLDGYAQSLRVYHSSFNPQDWVSQSA